MPYPPVIVVHLLRHRMRRRRLAPLLKKYDFNQVQWLEAVDGQTLDPTPPYPLNKTRVSPWPNWVDPYSRRALTLGEIGCALSHVKAWQAVVRNNEPTLILEDDAIPNELLIGDFPQVIYDLSYLDFSLCYLAQRNNPGPKPLAGRHVHIVDYHPLWTLAYLLSPEGAQKLLDSPWQSHLAPADEMLPAAFGLNKDPHINKVYAQNNPGLVLSLNQRLFNSAEGSIASETEKSQAIKEPSSITALTVASDDTPELQRLLNCGTRYGLAIQVLGKGIPWKGGDMKGPGGGQKINLLRQALKKLPSQQTVLFVDGYDTLVTRHSSDILQAWQEIDDNATPLFAAEVFCWPDKSLADRYPENDSPYRFLNSGAFIGKAGDLLNIIRDKIADHEDDQAYYTQRFLSQEYPIKLDYQCKLFQCLNGSINDVTPDSGRGILYNHRMDSWPAVIHANGPSKPWLDKAGYAVGGRWRKYYGDME